MKNKRSYYGEETAELLVDWLNSRAGKRPESVARLVQLNADFTRPMRAFEARQKIDYELHRTVAKSGLAKAPVLVDANAQRWTVDWKLVGTMVPTQAMALFRLLDLAEQGLLSRVRRCANPKCRKWFFAKFPHALSHTAKCRDAAAKADVGRRERRRAYERKYYRENLSGGRGK